jgi:hypothetical protein
MTDHLERLEYAVRNPTDNIVTVPESSSVNARKMAAMAPGSTVVVRTVTDWADIPANPWSDPQHDVMGDLARMRDESRNAFYGKAEVDE